LIIPATLAVVAKGYPALIMAGSEGCDSVIEALLQISLKDEQFHEHLQCFKGIVMEMLERYDLANQASFTPWLSTIPAMRKHTTEPKGTKRKGATTDSPPSKKQKKGGVTGKKRVRLHKQPRNEIQIEDDW